MWMNIVDFRDDAGICGQTWEFVIDDALVGDITEDELPSLPEGADHAWKSGGRWLCR